MDVHSLDFVGQPRNRVVLRVALPLDVRALAPCQNPARILALFHRTPRIPNHVFANRRVRVFVGVHHRRRLALGVRLQRPQRLAFRAVLVRRAVLASKLIYPK